MQRTSPPPSPFPEGEPSSFVDAQTDVTFTDSCDTSDILSDHFLDPHVLPSLPNYDDFAQFMPIPRSSLGYLYSLTPPMVSQDLQDVEAARNSLPPPYEEVFDRSHPERSSENQVEEFQRVLDNAKGALEKAYHDACQAASDLMSAEEDPDTSRWQTEGNAKGRQAFGTIAFPLVGARRKNLGAPNHSGQLVNLS